MTKIFVLPLWDSTYLLKADRTLESFSKQGNTNELVAPFAPVACACPSVLVAAWSSQGRRSEAWCIAGPSLEQASGLGLGALRLAFTTCRPMNSSLKPIFLCPSGRAAAQSFTLRTHHALLPAGQRMCVGSWRGQVCCPSAEAVCSMPL